MPFAASWIYAQMVVFNIFENRGARYYKSSGLWKF
jgi:hypothetical protein